MRFKHTSPHSNTTKPHPPKLQNHKSHKKPHFAKATKATARFCKLATKIIKFGYFRFLNIFLSNVSNALELSNSWALSKICACDIASLKCASVSLISRSFSLT